MFGYVMPTLEILTLTEVKREIRSELGKKGNRLPCKLRVMLKLNAAE